MEPFGELLASDQQHTLAFFVAGLRDASEPGVDQEELLYNASVLAHFALVSTQATRDLPSPAWLGDVFDRFVVAPTLVTDVDLLESGGAQCLMLAGFFEDQMRRRHSISWYSQLGAGFFRSAALAERAAKKARLLGMLSVRFEAWRQRQARLARELRVRPYVINARAPGQSGPRAA